MLLEWGMMNSEKVNEWDVDKSNNQKAIFKASAQKNIIFDLLQEQFCQSAKQLELGFILLAHSPDSRKHSCCSLPLKKQDSLIQNRNG